MNRNFLAGVVLGSAFAAAASGIAALTLPAGRHEPLYELSYYSAREPFPDERGYDLKEGDPGASFHAYDNSYLLSMVSRCRIRDYVVSSRQLPDGGRLASARFPGTAGPEAVACLRRFVDERSFVKLEPVTR